MKKLVMLFFWGAILLLSVAHLAAQNTVDVIGGPQPANTAGCAVNPHCIPAVWSTTSNAGSDISAPITANFVFASNGGASPTHFPAPTSRRISLAATRDHGGPTLFFPIGANFHAAPCGSLLLLRGSATHAPSPNPACVI